MTRELYKIGDEVFMLVYETLEERLQQINTYAKLAYSNEEFYDELR